MLNKHIHNLTNSHKHTLVNRHSFYQGFQIVLNAWSHYLAFDYCIDSIQEYTGSSLLLRLLSFIRSFQRISQLLITMQFVHPMVALTLYMQIKVSIILRNQLFHSIEIVIIKSSFTLLQIWSFLTLKIFDFLMVMAKDHQEKYFS